jgi:hypothetical protein
MALRLVAWRRQVEQNRAHGLLRQKVALEKVLTYAREIASEVTTAKGMGKKRLSRNPLALPFSVLEKELPRSPWQNREARKGLQ